MRFRQQFLLSTVLGLVCGNAASAATYTYTSIDVPGYSNVYLSDLNGSDVAVGYVQQQGQPAVGVVWSMGSSTVVPQSAQLVKIDAAGLAIGYVPVHGMRGNTYLMYDTTSGLVSSNKIPRGAFTLTGNNASGVVTADVVHAESQFFGALIAGSKSTRLVYPNAPFTDASAINNSGTVVGVYTDTMRVLHYYTYSSGLYKSFDFPYQKTSNAAACCISNSGMIGGFYRDQLGTMTSFIRKGSTDTILNIPNTTNLYIIGFGLNDEVVGNYTDTTGTHQTHGFVYSNNVYYKLDYPGNVFNTFVSGVNQQGNLVGSYTTDQGNTIVEHGFIAECPSGQICTQ